MLLLDGMVLDISRWIEEHPGGSSIIPEQGEDFPVSLYLFGLLDIEEIDCMT